MCLGPLTAYKAGERSPRRGPLLFNKRAAFAAYGEFVERINVPCQQCMECRLEKSKNWAMRCMHEKRLWKESAFLTLTYSDENLPLLQGPDIRDRETLEKRDLQLFMKKLRHKLEGPVRFYACGEYGDKTGRPHYHVLLLSHDLPDKKFFSNGKREGEKYYKSELLEKTWGLGHTLIGDVTFDSCAYVARYVTKKITGEYADAVYLGRCPEFPLMSRKPGIGRGYFNKYNAEIYGGLSDDRNDNVVVNGVLVSPPRYYDELWRMVDPVGVKEIKEERRRKFLARYDRSEDTNRRRVVREIVSGRRMKLWRPSL